MRNLFLLLFLVASPFFVQSESIERIEDQAKLAVKNEIIKQYKPGNCEKWKVLESSGQAKVGSALANCDGAFNPAFELSFSDVKVFQHENYNAVCGVVSGRTDVSKIGGRFVFTDGANNHVFIKLSKYPAFLMDESPLSKNMLKILDNQLQVESKVCKK
ncbi:hypothetical protein EFJ13_12715 [Salmonella enterica]|uniref:Uncharacterized protein n=1 Tax=Salmonella enterica subsp. enterica serovar Saintpaul TaxID=90105 RepID=A0A5W5JD82_SALET|nr:hypothetical protein [Salmonella enterica]EBX1943197.1 hypothetical protein [Salmonella enterica subsp. enterica serovar Saintpaul]EAT8462399.1 hypothetical protein [Salmonella enterica]EAW5279969.1 hypothetical protein [Salmonella enterica]EBN2770864.1 hypothetical protein [Salmonella enterica]